MTFQSTYPRRVRRLTAKGIAQLIAISIHVPTKGTTIMSLQAQNNTNISIHVPTKGTTWYLGNVLCQILISIHVPTKGTTPRAKRNGNHASISIHVPTKGTTPAVLIASLIVSISIHVPTKGTTAKIYNNIPSFLLIFIYFPIFSYQNIKSTLFKNNYWYFFQCESLCIFLSASYSHLQNTQVQHLSAFLYELWQTSQLLH